MQQHDHEPQEEVAAAGDNLPEGSEEVSNSVSGSVSGSVSENVEVETAVNSAETAHSFAAAKASAKALAIQAALAGQEKNASHIQIIDLDGRVDYADYLVLMTGSSNRNVSAIAQSVEMTLKKDGHRIVAMEGLPSAEWVLIDLFDVVVHVFQADWRQEYDLDGLWADADRISF